ncbi:hypothetical protein K8089_08410 [Aequorivita sp. F47161]|uniref:Uncharacterized protein n=1 Tax=Aequorivita vitellina TaxID=2874475 RepID=A0A9X1U2Y6_9FLAO|nr:hypothetical protein [Aequorivita vitellina]MCG2419043.1 hypothetical protein [Aequorivita vitellina]
MIAITDTSGYSNLNFIVPIQEISLTIPIVNQYLVGNAIINSTITTEIRNLLISILGNSNVSASAISELATYSGFYLDTNNSPSTISFNSANASIDKLTFYVIFRLPSTHNLLELENINNGEISNSIGNNPVKWGKFANYIRSLSGSGVIKINSAGEQVNNSGEAIDDNNTVIEGWYQKRAYEFLDVRDYLDSNAIKPKPFETGNTIPSGLFTEIEEYNLFYSNDIKIPIYFYLLSHTENRYSPLNWLNPNKESSYISRIPHWPSNITAGERVQHFVKTVNPADMSLFTENGSFLLNENSNGFYIVLETNTIYIEPVNDNAIMTEFLDLNDVLAIQYLNNNLYATWDILENRILNKNSGLTIGMGVDLGATFSSYYTVEFTLSIAGSGTFQFYYGNKKSQELNHNVTNTQLKSELSELIDKDHPNEINITNISSGKKITIIRNNQTSSNKDRKTYYHKIYVGKTSGSITISLTPQDDGSRWIPIPTTINDSWFLFSNFLDYSFSDNPILPPVPPVGITYYSDPDNNETYFWLNNSFINLNLLEKEKILMIFKRSFGNRKNAGINYWSAYKEVLKKFELPSYVLNMSAAYELFKNRFFNKNAIIKNGALSRNYPVGSTIEEFLAESNLICKPNQVELLAISLYTYVKGAGEFKNKKLAFIKAINQHSYKALKSTVSNMDSNRLKVLDKFYLSAKTKLYHDLDA